MAGSLQILVFDKKEKVYGDVFSGSVELGRQRDGREVLYCSRREGDKARVAIARLDEDTVSREHALLDPLPSGRVRLTNRSAKVSIRLSDGGELKAGTSCEVQLPTVIALGRKTVHIQSADAREGPPLHGLPEAMTPPGSLLGTSPTGSGMQRFATLSLQSIQSIIAPGPADKNAQMEEVVRWLQTLMEVLSSAASSSDFFQKAAQAVVDIVGLDHGRVLLYDEAQWKTAAVDAAAAAAPSTQSQQGRAAEWRPSQHILQRVLQEKRTFWQDPAEMDLEDIGSLVGVEIVVVSPILDPQGAVIGAIYGDCRQDSPMAAAPKITKVEAIVVELLARGVAVGLARMEQEQAAVAARVQFEQFFTRELSQQLAREPNLLDGRDAEVSLLFCDIRAFSRISEKLGPERTVRWVSQVMGTLSDCVLKHQGVLVDYIGDELMAMWGAPVEQPNHAQLACQAALDMLNSLPALNERWQPILGEPLHIGIGLNTGMARVGNTGSRQKFKYGPLGNTVNLASRVQGATKYLKCPLLLTEWTQSRLGDRFRTRRLCQVRVVNIQQPVCLYELLPESFPYWPNLKVRYEQALDEFNARNFRPAARILSNLLGEVAQDDGPSLVLLSRAVNALVDGAEEKHPVWDLPGK
jgi:adenylate cyclase